MTPEEFNAESRRLRALLDARCVFGAEPCQNLSSYEVNGQPMCSWHYLSRWPLPRNDYTDMVFGNPQYVPGESEIQYDPAMMDSLEMTWREFFASERTRLRWMFAGTCLGVFIGWLVWVWL